jgi:hypothetical protein
MTARIELLLPSIHCAQAAHWAEFAPDSPKSLSLILQTARARGPRGLPLIFDDSEGGIESIRTASRLFA